MGENGTSEKPFPLLDLESICLRDDATEDEYLQLGLQIIKAFDDYGFIYLKNFGFSKEEFKNISLKFDEFFDQELEEKMKYKRNICKLHGYADDEYELVPDSHLYVAKRDIFDFREIEGPFPEVPGLRDDVLKLIPRYQILGRRIMKAIGKGLNVPDNLFEKYHDVMGPKNLSGFHILRYRPILEEKDDQIRLIEHGDVIVTVTIEFYDDMEGLQIKDKQGTWQDVGIYPDAVLLFPSLELQKWTGDRIEGTFHRVVVPKSKELRKLPRHVFIGFIHANDDVIMETLDGFNKYPPITAREAFKQGVKTFCPDYEKYEPYF